MPRQTLWLVVHAHGILSVRQNCEAKQTTLDGLEWLYIQNVTTKPQTKIPLGVAIAHIPWMSLPLYFILKF